MLMSNLSVVEISERCGVRHKTEGVLPKIEANKIGRVAFLDPEARISPLRRTPPFITNLCILLECYFF